MMLMKKFPIGCYMFLIEFEKKSWASWNKISEKEDDVLCKGFYLNRVFPKWWSIGCEGDWEEALLPHGHYLTFSLLRNSALGLGKGRASLCLDWSEGGNSRASPQLCYFKGTRALPRSERQQQKGGILPALGRQATLPYGSCPVPASLGFAV